MENIFIILAIIASVIYKFYQNYQEEMEKAAKRKQQQARPVPPPPADIPQPSRSQQRPSPIPPPTRIPEIKIPAPRKPATPGTIPRTQPDTPAKLTQAHRLKVEKERNKSIELIVDEEENTLGNSPMEIEFDLKTAVIQTAILERPYK